MTTKSIISKPWQKFLVRLLEYQVVDISDWTEIHLLGYLCNRFEKHFGKKYVFGFSGAPTKCQELYFIKKLQTMLAITDARLTQAYIDWVFDQKIIPKGTKIHSFGFLTVSNYVNEFGLMWEEKNKIKRTTELPIHYKNIVETMKLPIKNYGDLAFIKMALDQDKDNESRKPYRDLFQTIINMGFDPKVLNNLS